MRRECSNPSSKFQEESTRIIMKFSEMYYYLLNNERKMKKNRRNSKTIVKFIIDYNEIRGKGILILVTNQL